MCHYATLHRHLASHYRYRRALEAKISNTRSENTIEASCVPTAFLIFNANHYQHKCLIRRNVELDINRLASPLPIDNDWYGTVSKTQTFENNCISIDYIGFCYRLFYRDIATSMRQKPQRSFVKLSFLEYQCSIASLRDGELSSDWWNSINHLEWNAIFYCASGFK